MAGRVGMIRAKISAPDRFWKRVQMQPNGCWTWTGGIARATGYGCFTINRNHRISAHRYAYEITHGPIPDGYHVDHLCRNRACVNPAHLEAVTPRENILRGSGITAINASKTHCEQGHEFTAENTVLVRVCLTCRRATQKRFDAKRQKAGVRR